LYDMTCFLLNGRNCNDELVGATIGDITQLLPKKVEV